MDYWVVFVVIIIIIRNTIIIVITTTIIIIITVIIIMVSIDNVTGKHNMGQCRRHWEAIETSWDGLLDGLHHYHHSVCSSWWCDKRTRHGMVRRHWEAMETSWKDCIIVIIIININIIMMVYMIMWQGDFNMGQCRGHWETTETSQVHHGLHCHHHHCGVGWQCDWRTQHLAV